MNVFEVDRSENSIVLDVEFSPSILLNEKSRIILNIFKENLSIRGTENEQRFEKLLNMVLKHPFKKQLKISQLNAGTSFKFQFILENGGDLVQKNIFACTKSQSESSLKSKMFEDSSRNTGSLSSSSIKGLCESEDLLYRTALAQQINTTAFQSEKQILKKILDARKAKGSADFIHESYKFAKPAKNREERMKRTLLVAQGLEMSDKIYGHREATLIAGETENKGLAFGKNNWFMGPFYSYDHNSTQMQKNQIKKQLSNTSASSSLHN